MITKKGKIIRSGIAIAVAAKVTVQSGINAVSETILQQGLISLRKGLPPQDYPEVVVVSDNLSVAASTKIPGINITGIASESDAEIHGLIIDVPCVIGLPGLLKSINEGDIVIIDGNKGEVYIDPDSKTLTHYQQLEQSKNAQGRIFIELNHMPARTQSGETINIYAYVSSLDELEQAMESGADAIIADYRAIPENDREPLWMETLRQVACKPAQFILDMVSEDLLKAILGYKEPAKVTILSSPADFEYITSRMNMLFQRLVEVTPRDSLLQPEISFGLFTHESEYSGELLPIYALTIDIRNSELSDKNIVMSIPDWIGKHSPDEVVFVIGAKLGLISGIVKAGARNIAINPKLVQETKNIVRAI